MEPPIRLPSPSPQPSAGKPGRLEEDRRGLGTHRKIRCFIDASPFCGSSALSMGIRKPDIAVFLRFRRANAHFSDCQRGMVLGSFLCTRQVKKGEIFIGFPPFQEERMAEQAI